MARRSGTEFLMPATREPAITLSWGTGKFFVASQNPLLPVLCVKANRIISIVRPNMQTNTAGNTYGGYTSGSSETLMEGWPASVLGENRSSASETDLPTDQTIPYWNILLPAIARIILSPGDLITDDLNRTAVIAGSELTDLGWRISAKDGNHLNGRSIGCRTSGREHRYVDLIPGRFHRNPASLARFVASIADGRTQPP